MFKDLSGGAKLIPANPLIKHLAGRFGTGPPRSSDSHGCKQEEGTEG